MAFDPFLYAALAIGMVVGHFARPKGPWVGRAQLATVVVLVGLLGATLSAVPGPTLLGAIPLALSFVLVMLGVTAVVYLGIARRSTPHPPLAPSPPSGRTVPLSPLLIASLVVGLWLGTVVHVPASGLLEYVLYLLLALIGLDLVVRGSSLRRVWEPLTAATAGAIAAAALFVALRLVPLRPALASAFGFGFYSLTGPIVSERAGAVLGLFAFLVNFLREDLTMIVSPLLGRRLGGGGLAAFGGATSMDTTLMFVTRYGEPEAASLAIANGLILTVAAAILVPAVFSIAV